MLPDCCNASCLLAYLLACLFLFLRNLNNLLPSSIAAKQTRQLPGFQFDAAVERQSRWELSHCDDRRCLARLAQLGRHPQHAELRQSREEHPLRRHAQRRQRRLPRLRIRGDRQETQGRE